MPLATKSQMITQAQMRMRLLNISPAKIDDFVKTGNVPLFHEWQEVTETAEKKRVEVKKTELEQKFGCKVYAITHDRMSFGEIYNFLFVSKYPADWFTEFHKQFDGDGMAIAYAYAWNISDDWKSESGTIAVRSVDGAVQRVI